MLNTRIQLVRAAILFAAIQQCGCCGVSQQTEVSFPEAPDTPPLEEQLATIDEREPDESQAENLRPLASPEFTMSAAALAEEFASDKSAAKEKYGFKRIRVDGKVIEVGEDESGVPFVVLEGHESTPVSVGFPASQSAYVTKIKMDDHVVLQGNFASFLSDEEVSLYDGGIVSFGK